ncbi:MAG: FAD-containing oxidoreductase, partial [Planctomycetaceae bacterium]
SEVSVAMAGGITMGRLASVIHPYPTVADAIRRLGDQYNRQRLTPLVKWVLRTWLRWRIW